MSKHNPRVPRKKGQPAGSKKHSDLYTDENPKGTIKGLKFATVKDAKSSVSKINNSGKVIPKYVKCNNCNKMYHEYCISKWKYKRNMVSTVCPHCSMDNLYLHDFYVDYCCFSWKLKKNNLREKITNFD